MRMTDVIVRKRDGAALSRADIDFVVAGVCSGTVPDYQVSALLMAMVLRGMTADETLWLTEAMTRSGSRIDLSTLPGVKIGKHSTGGVGDKTSIVVVPIVAACGVIAPKSSGRGLGHTGGTVDKLESIPGFRVEMERDRFFQALETVGCVFVGQTADIAPADKKLYAMRDVTGTVESVPLIASSIMSKKIAEGTDGLVLDVKVGRGAFMKHERDARELASAMVAIGGCAGVRTEAVLTAMEAPLGRAVGNALEIAECLDTLEGKGPPDLEHLCLVLAGRMLRLAGAAPDVQAGESRARAALRSGAALETFRRVVELQGGDPRIVQDRGRLPRAARSRPVTAERAGIIGAVHADLIGRASMALGAGRDHLDATIDPGAGIVLHVAPGDRVERGQPLCELHTAQESRLPDALRLVTAAMPIGDEPAVPAALMLGVVA